VKAIRTIAALEHFLNGDDKPVHLVPTMGALHAGHLALVEAALQSTNRVIVSIFVNPMQFGPQEDLNNYPRTLNADLAKLSQFENVHVFAPEASEMYPPEFATSVEVSGITAILCGKSRPHHFRGVTTVVHKLLSLTKPDMAFFGEKDYQQLVIIRRMVSDLHLPVKIVGVPIVRESDGLAMSSRNQYLTPEQRSRASAIYRALHEARAAYQGGKRERGELLALARRVLQQSQVDKIDYIELASGEDLTRQSRAEANSRLFIAASYGATRLIDNLALPG
jgi:pantoate--beta-alanine ligase